MVKTCFVPMCNSGYKSCLEKVSLFKVPEDRLILWQKKIARKDRLLSTKDFICEKHFDKQFIIREVKNKLYTYPLKIPRLSDNAMPTIFPGCPLEVKKRRRVIKQCSVVKKRKKIDENLSENYKSPNPMEEDKVHLFDDSNYLINSEGVKKENQSLLDTQITFEKVQSSIKPKNIEENYNEGLGNDCWVGSKINNSNKETDNSDPGDECGKNPCKIKEERRDSDFFVDVKKFLHNEDEEKDCGDECEKTSCKIKEEVRDSDFSEEDDKNFLCYEDKVRDKDEAMFEFNSMNDHRIKYEDEDESGSKINDSDDESDDFDPGNKSENSLCNIKEEGGDSHFSEDDKNSIHSEDKERDENEATFETKIEVEYHGVEYDDEYE